MPVDTSIRILLVEDAGTMRKMETKILGSLGFSNILEAVDGADAISQLQNEEHVDLIIADWNMPNVDGFEFLQWVRGNNDYKELPFIMATGRGEKKEISKANEAGVSGFISKPFNADELKDKIQEAFGENRDESAGVLERVPRLTESGKVRLTIAHIQITDHLVLGVLQHLIQTGELAPEYFELETQCLSSWNPVAKALENGSVDGACVLAPIAMDLFAYGTPISLILYAHKNGSILVRNRKGGVYQEPYKDFFRDKSFYIPHTMSIHNMLAHMFFSKIGLNPGYAGGENVDVSFEVVPPIKMPEFLAINERAAGYMVAEPLGTQAIAADIAEQQFLSSEFWDNHPCCVVTMQKEFVDSYPDAVYEFTKMLVYAGKYIERATGKAAEIGVKFLDPDGTLGLKKALIKNIITDPKGIKTDDLFPNVDNLEYIQQYMHNKMGIGNIVDLNDFIDLRFAKVACKDRKETKNSIVLNDSAHRVQQLLQRGASSSEEEVRKEMLNLEGKYLTFLLNNQHFGIDILSIKEIIGMLPIRSIPQTPHYFKGVVVLRGNTIPVIDLRLKFGLEELEYHDRTCIIIIEYMRYGKKFSVGLVVDAVMEVSDIKSTDIEKSPTFGCDTDTEYILGMAKINDQVRILLDLQPILSNEDTEQISEVFAA